LEFFQKNSEKVLANKSLGESNVITNLDIKLTDFEKMDSIIQFNQVTKHIDKTKLFSVQFDM